MFRSGLFVWSLVASPVVASLASAQPESPAKASNPLVTALAFSHVAASPKSLTPGKDRQLKTALITALAEKPRSMALESVGEFFDKTAFVKVAGGTSITLEQMERIVKDRTPQSRKDMFEKTRQHADLLATQFDMIGATHREAADTLAAWIVKNYQSDKPLGIIVICTGNSRRSILGATTGNIASAYYGLPNVAFSSGGTTPTAFNPRTVATLKEIGVEIEATGKEAPRGKSGDANPIFSVRWGKGLEMVEYSKPYSDARNPQKGFAAILVCSDADTSCPKVEGASVRIPVPYLDPKAFDGAEFEAAKYAERRDDIGRFMLNVLLQARRQLETADRLK